MIELTAVDRTILKMMQNDSKSRLEDIAQQAGASVSTIQRRLKYLTANGVLIGETAVVSPEAVGQKMTFLILVEMERERIDILDAFRRKIKAEDRVQQCYYITGEADFALIALAQDMDCYRDLIQKLFFDDVNIKRFRTSVAMERVKVGIQVAV